MSPVESPHKPTIKREESLIDLPSRFETIESLFIAYRLTGHPQYREWGWDIFQSVMEDCRVPSGGYSGIKNVNVTLEPHPDGGGYRNRVSQRKRGAGAEGAAENLLSQADGDLVQVDDVGLQLVHCHLPWTKFFAGTQGRDRQRLTPSVTKSESEESYSRCLRRIDNIACWRLGLFESDRRMCLSRRCHVYKYEIR